MTAQIDQIDFDFSMTTLLCLLALFVIAAYEIAKRRRGRKLMTTDDISSDESACMNITDQDRDKWPQKPGESDKDYQARIQKEKQKEQDKQQPSGR